ncbi:hypothetical protein AURDEDRAFT_176839 [Auricularia subglabra TFB-10046 SS5]|uniref:Fungal N-terminal domain-containing protein n=1 Tax=Auricularia subglabra (strain TFB-10046 / SS5) TaxID=717982 RepID=J0WNY1_AURST|nr:hypothetical protein AURDEDRAFT_176839 [Auricularia subglabra TFB-10046 SS5]
MPSFGDIITVLQLAWQIRAALSDAAGARAEIAALVVELDSFTQALQQVQSSLAQRSAALDPAVENGITHALAVCSGVLRRVIDRITAFRARTTGGAHGWRNYWKLAAWSVLGGREAIDRLRRRLFEQVQAIHTFLFLSQAADISALTQTVGQQGETLRALCDGALRISVMRRHPNVPHIVWDPLAERHYEAYTCTSLSRLHALHCYGYEPERPFVMDLNALTGDLWVCAGSATPVTNLYSANIAFRIPENIVLILSCVFWRDRPFDHWEVLVGLPGPLRGVFGPEAGLRLFLERKDVQTFIRDHANATASRSAETCLQAFRTSLACRKWWALLRRTGWMCSTNEMCCAV